VPNNETLLFQVAELESRGFGESNLRLENIIRWHGHVGVSGEGAMIIEGRTPDDNANENGAVGPVGASEGKAAVAEGDTWDGDTGEGIIAL